MTVHDYYPSFHRYPPGVIRGLTRIDAVRAVIRTARILPAQEDILRRDAKVGSVHYSNLIEGNELPALEAERAVDHELEPTTRAKLELVNYVAALDFIESSQGRGTITYTPEFLKELHGVLTRGLGRDGDSFEQRHEGEWRNGPVAVRDALTVYHYAPPAEEVPALMEKRLGWLEEKRHAADYFPPILAGVAHFEVAEVHPFADYNGRAARLFATAVMMREGLLERRLFSPEHFYANDRDAYFTALRAVKATRNLDAWLTYYTGGLAEEFERVADRVSALNLQADRLPAVQLTPHQEKAVAELTAGARAFITRAEFEDLTGLRKTQAAAELGALVEAGVFRSVGQGPGRRYELAGRSSSSGRRGPTPHWTEERVRAELQALTDEFGHFPTPVEFRSDGKWGLYLAASRLGGLRRWRSEIGVSRD